MTKISDLYGMLPDVFDAQKVERSLGSRASRRSVSRALGRYVSDGRLVRVKGGAYAKPSADKFAVAAFVYGGYIGFSSALYVHGLKTEIEDVVYVCVGSVRKPVNFLDARIKPIHFSRLLYGTAIVNGIVVSTYAKTLFDILYKPRYSSFFDFYRALSQRRPSSGEWREMLAYIREANLAVVRRAGHALEGIGPGWFMKSLSAMNPRVGKSFFIGKAASGFDKKWLIYDSANVARWKHAV